MNCTPLQEIASQYSDMYKDVYGFRPRHAIDSWSEADYTKAIQELTAGLERRASTFEGREALREEGWWYNETDPELQRKAIAAAEARDAALRAQYSDEDWSVYWSNYVPEAAKMRKNWGVV